MTIGLGLESSCDETSASVVEDGALIRSNVISSQIDLHSAYFGVVPEIASRAHLELINGVIQNALDDAGLAFSDLDFVSCANRPGLIGSLMISLQSAKTISYALNIPLITVSHIESHLYAAFLSNPELQFPFIGLLISGGNTALYLVKGISDLTLIGRTTDDAVGEAYDKVSKFLNLGYPGGPIIDKLAKSAVRKNISFPKRVNMKNDPFDFSYSGLKTAVVNYITNNPDAEKEEIVFAFQESAVEIIISRLILASEKFGIDNVVVAGGVAANSRLRERLSKLQNINVFIPEPVLCTDNAAMVAGLGYHYYTKKLFSELTCEVYAKDSDLRIKGNFI